MYSNRIRSHVALVVAMILLSCCAASGLWLAHQKEKADAWVRHTFEVKDNLSQVRVSLLRAEVYRRSYILGDRQARDTLSVICRDIPRQLSTLRRSTIDNDSQRARTSALERLAIARLAEIKQTILLGDKSRRSDAAAAMASDSNHRTTAAIIELIGHIAAEEQRLLAVRLKQAQSYERPIQAGLVCSGLLVLLLGLLVHTERRKRMLALGTANARLQADIARRELAESELALLAANATDAVLRIDPDGCCIYASPSVQQVLGVEACVLVGQPLGTSIHPADREDMLAFHHLLVSGALERGVRTYRAQNLDVSQREIWIEAHSGLVRDTATGKPREVITSLRDVTERKRLEFELGAARSRAEAAVRAKSSFLANMSHEIRTPMNGVLGFADLLLNSDMSAENRHHAQLIVDSGKAMMRLLNDILDLSKIEAGQMQISPETIDLRHAVRSCIKLVQPAASQKGLQLDVHVADGLPVHVLVDGLRLRQIILNLLANAVKFTPSGRVRLRANIVDGEAGATLEVTVEDTGIGIPADRQAAVFELFTQAEHSTVKRFGGTGLGLAISKQLADLMGGSLELASEEGVGTTFRLHLPLVEARSSEDTPASTSSAAQANRSLRVLLAEDHDVNQALMRAMLLRLGHECVIVGDGLQAVEAAIEADKQRETAFDLVLMDMQMPIMDGLEAARKIRAAGIAPARLPLLALTANAYADDITACLEAGMQAHLAKPIELASLAASLQKWSGSHAPQTTVAAAFTISPALQARFDARKAELGVFAQRLATCDDVADEQIKHLKNMLHKLAGSAGMFNEKPLGSRAAELEERLGTASSHDRGDIVRAVVRAVENAV
jgi:PAS domain S-box-containing protein